jgi:hypothetical protein
MVFAYQILLILHVVAMATWFGVGLSQPRRARAALSGPADTAKVVLASITREVRIIGAAAATTILSGLALIFVRGGFAAMPPRIHIGLALALVAALVGGLGAGRTFAKINTMLETRPPSEALPLAKKLSAYAGVFQLLWLVVLVLMLWRL